MLSNLGYGWSLNFPRLGTNYVHFPGGLAISYSWYGNVMEYHGSVDFKIVNKGSYALYMKSGTNVIP
jgi:hypothetical protein